MTGFPFLRLPLLPAKAVLDMMSPLEITLLFACSEQTRNFIYTTKKEVSYDLLSIEQKKNLNALEILQFLRFKVRNRPFRGREFKVADTIEIQLHLYDHRSPRPLSNFSVHVVCINEHHRYKGMKGNFEIDGVTIPVIMTDKQTLYTFWNCLYEGLSILSDYYIEKMFGPLFGDYTICGSEEPRSSEYLKAAVKWMSQQSRIDDCYVKKLELISDDDYKNILDNVNPGLSYYHSGEPSEKFQHATSIKSRRLTLDPASWFTIDNLLNTESARIWLYKSKLTYDDMKEFLKQWVNGRFSNLECLSVEMEEEVDLDLILNVLPGYTPDKDIERQEYILNHSHNKICITRQDGLIATIYKNKGECFKMTVEPKK